MSFPKFFTLKIEKMDEIEISYTLKFESKVRSTRGKRDIGLRLSEMSFDGFEKAVH